jgi:hypothetical protein
MQDTMQSEFAQGVGAIAAEGVHGAKKIEGCSGRHGKFSKL